MKLKKAISGVLATAVLASAMLTSVQPALAWDAPENTWQAASNDGVKARFFIGSDLHIGRNQDAVKKLTNALEAFHTVDADPDAVLFVGDITNNGYESEYQTLMDTIGASELGKAGKVVLSMGNHEYVSGNMERFKTQTGQEANQVIYYDDAGNAAETPGDTLAATVIKLSAKNYNGDYTDQYDMVKAALEKATTKNPNAPVLIMGHHGIKDTAYVTNEWYGNYGKGTDKDMVALFKQYPQVIHFSGHSHATLEDARSIYQNDGYTAIQDGTVGAYFENESGKVDPTSGASATRPANSEVASQALRLDVLDDGTVKIYRMNLTTGEYMYVDEPWTFKAGDTNNRPYDESRTSAAPSFDAEAAVTASDVEEKAAKVSFPAATAASTKNNDMIHSYKITLTPQDGGSSVTRTVFADYYEAQPKSDWTVQVTGLAAGTTYDVAVTAVTSFGAESPAITGTLTTQAEKPYVTPEPDVLNIDFDSEHGTADANGHALTVFGQPTEKQDETFGTVYHFDGDDDGFRYTMSEADYDKFKDGYTMEVLVKIPDLTKSGKDPFANMQSAGCGFEIGSGKTIEFWNHVGGGYKIPSADISSYENEWVHLTATFDGQTTKLYVNGQLADSVESVGSMTVPPTGARYFYLGGDSNSDGTLQNPVACDIALARLYSGAMNATDVAKAYEAEMPDADYQTPEADVLDIDFNNGTADANGHSFSQVGAPTQEKDDVFGTVYHFDGSDDGFRYALSAEDYDTYKDGFSMELMVKLNNLDKNSDPFANMESAGCGFELKGDGQHIEFWNHVNGYKKPTADVSDYEGEWVHLMATFDSQSTKLYVNGQLEDSVASVGSMTVPPEGARYFYLGGDSNGSGDLQFAADCTIAFARLYSGAMNATDAAAAYEEATATYSATVAETANGSASVAPEATKAGNTVTITTAPAEGYKVDSVSVTDANDQSLAVTDNGDGTYSFIQPASDVTVNVTFAKESSGGSTGGTTGGVAHYTPDVAHNDGGTVSVTPRAPKAGDQVTVTMTPDEGYEVADVTVTDRNGEAVATTANADGTVSFEQPRGKVTITVTFAEKTAAWDNPYSDVSEEDWFFEPVRFVQENGLMTGTSAGTFAPDMTTTRGMLVTILWRQAGEPQAAAAADFSDVSADAYYADAVAWAAEAGIVNGYSASAFGPADAITREQMAAILMNYSEHQGSDVSARADLSGFSDAAGVSTWAEEAVQWAVSEGLIKGVTADTIQPQGQATRAQVAAILQRYLAG